jgi:DNA helicase-2/ATP-dependent DNA helicase PcrA
MSTFEESFARLNDAQKQAVETIEGPVMVIAGPGTGKTQTVGMRVANILRRTHMRPGNILCLTFSSSGATAMRERLRLLIGADAYGVKVSTIHGFCNEIISQNPHVFEEWAAMEQISDLERYREVNLIIDSLMPDLALVNRKHPHARTRDILGRMSQLKREGKDNIAELQKIADEYEIQLAAKSKEGTKAHERNILQARKFRELIQIFEKYQAMLKNTGRYDYDDMILYVIHALQSEDWLLASLQEKYQYILVDEFQDTNGGQYRFIELLTTYAGIDQAPNLFVVGDDDQAIYRFQGANVQNLLSFHARFPGAPVIALTTSYRSSQSILDAAGALITHNTERLVGRIPGLDKTLHSAIVHTKEALSPRMIFSASNAVEPWIIADMIEDRLKSGQAPDEIAILTQTNGELRPIYDVLRARELPVQMVGKVDLLTHPLIQQLLAILKAVHQPENNAVLATALSCDTFHCNPADLGRLFHLRRDKESSLITMLMTIESSVSSGEIVIQDIEQLIQARNCVLDLHHKLGSRTVIETVERVLKDSHFLPTETKELDPLDFSAIQAFYDHVCARAREIPHYSFNDLMQDLMFYEHPDYGDLRLQYVVPHLTQHGVRLMTAHQSKGLEFETVMVVNFREGHWDARRNPPMLAMPEDLLFGWERDQKSYEQNQDERRIAFVAMTRAKNELLFFCPKEVVSGDKARQVAPSAFFAEAGSLVEEVREVRQPEHASTLLRRPVRNLPEEFRAFLRERLETFELSASALNRFLNDPEEFLMMDLLQIPQGVHPEFLFGNAAHAALKIWGTRWQEKNPLTREEFFSIFEQTIMEETLATDAVRRALVQEGRDALPRYFDTCLATASPLIYRVEYAVRAHLNDIPLKGFVDRIDIDHPESNIATVIDYKTGKPKTENEIRDSDLYRQLTFYSLLFDLGQPFVQPKAFVLEFIGGGTEHPVSRVFQISDQEKSDLKKQIEQVWQRIQALDFSPL